ncbi:MAG: murein tripeptide amidase MpaA [Xanthomonadales bacterium]|jgi:protein MpaA|nr:murein tripeptide amidase MpaA [Xanthomonadales bacterium]
MKKKTHDPLVPRPRRGILRHPPHDYGSSLRGTPLQVYGPATGPVDILIMAAMHGDECDTTVVLSEALRSVPETCAKNPVILSVNPDGALRGTRCNAAGVDLNRNWPTANWCADPVYYRGHGQERQEIELSTGASAASEPETRSLLGLVQKLRPRAVISLHAPLACIEDPDARPLGRWIAEQVPLPLVPDVGYATPGSFGTWCVEQGINIITWELPAESLPDLMASHVPVLRKLIMGGYPAGAA